jgi:DNA invertase Pin-like site-specific DNA recombinase
MPKAYSYTRFSSPEQASGDSVRRQMAGTDAWLAGHPEIELDTRLTFADHGRSGFRGQQFSDGALGRFVDGVRGGAIESGSYLLIENLDRFSRENPMTATSRLFDLANMGITIVTTSDGLEYSADTLSGRDVSRLSDAGPPVVAVAR